MYKSEHHLCTAQFCVCSWTSSIVLVVKVCSGKALVCVFVFCLGKARSRLILCAAVLEYFMPCTQLRVVHDKKGIITRAVMFPGKRQKKAAAAKHYQKIRDAQNEIKKKDGWWKRRFHPRRTKTNKHNPMGRAHSLCVREAHNAASAQRRARAAKLHQR